MDFAKLIARAKNVLLTPKSEWPVIAAETDSVAGLYKNYILILAAITPVAMFIKSSFIGTGFLGVSYRQGIGSGLTQMILTYAISLGLVFVAALIADGFAGTFGAQKGQTQALKAVAYAWTPSWIAGIGMLAGIPLGSLLALAAFIYAIWLLNQGLQQTMKTPPDKSAGHTAVTIILTVIAAFIINAVVLVPMGLSAYGNRMHLGDSNGSISVDKDSALGKLAAIGEKAAEASKQMEQAQKSGDTHAQAEATGKAVGQMLGAVLGGGDTVEALAPDALKPFLPDKLGGMPRTSMEVQRNAAIGIQVSNAKATYRNPQGDGEIDLEITDTGGAKGFMALAGFANVEKDSESDSGYEKTYHADGRLVHEKWDKDGSGEFSIILGDRFIVEVKGSGMQSIDVLKSAVGALNLSGLEALKNQGVKKG